MNLMVLSTATPTARKPLRAVSGRRADAERVAIAVNDALAPCVEGQALIADVEAGVLRITTAAMAGSRTAVVNEANRLAFRAGEYRQEFRRLAEAIEGTGGPDAA